VRRSRSLLLALPLAIVGSLALAAPAHAATEPIFGTTVEVTLFPSGDSLLGSTAYFPDSGGGIVVTVADAPATAIQFELLDGPTTVASCTVAIATTGCSTGSAGLTPGTHSVTARFTQGATTVEHTGTLFSVLTAAPSVTLEWQDAAGNWVDGASIGLPLFGETAMRCVVTNNSNAPFTFLSFTGAVSFVGSPSPTPITGTLAGGATGHYPIWSGPSSTGASGGCTGSVTLASGIGSGNGTGGGIIPISGTIEASPALAPGRTVTVEGAGLVPPVITSFEVLFDGVPVDGSPVALSGGPDYAFTIDVDIPATLAPGTHAITVVGSYSDREIAFAYFPLEIAAPVLPATGVDVVTPAGSALAVLVLGGVVVLAAARRRRA
jgi:hypothetical protein